MTAIQIGQHFPISLESVPATWTSGYVGDFAETVQSGFACGKHGRGDTGIAHLRPMNVSRAGSIDLLDVKTVDPAFNSKRLSAGDVLFNNTNSPELVGKTAVVSERECGFAFSNHMTRVVFSKNVSARFFAIQLHYLWSQKYFLHRCVKHVNQASVSATELAERIPLICPPSDEQRRIVERIEALFDDVNRGIKDLHKAKLNLDFYRQSLLNSAFDGRLTADWRERNVDKLEDPRGRLERMKTRRQELHNAAIDDWRIALDLWIASDERGTRPIKPRRPNEFPPDFVDLRVNLPSLPDCWKWSHLGWCSMGPEYGTSTKSDASGEVPVIRMGNIQDGRIDWTNLVYSSDRLEIEKYLLRTGDVLFNRTNSPELVGKTAICESDSPAIFAGYLVRINQVDDFALGSFVSHFLNSPIARKYGSTVKTDGVNQSNINGTKLQEYPFPYCSSTEQAEIVRLLDTHLEAAGALEAEIDAALTRADAFRQSILKKAFSGQLVPQDPTDEPASILLERIRAERAQAPKSTRKRRTAA